MKFRRAQENASFKKVLREEIEELIQQEASNEEIIEQCEQRVKSTSLTNIDITVMVSSMKVVGNIRVLVVCPLQLWRCVMGSVEWNKKEELVAEQALKHLKVCILVAVLCRYYRFPND